MSLSFHLQHSGMLPIFYSLHIILVSWPRFRDDDQRHGIAAAAVDNESRRTRQ